MRHITRSCSRERSQYRRNRVELWDGLVENLQLKLNPQKTDTFILSGGSIPCIMFFHLYIFPQNINLKPQNSFTSKNKQDLKIIHTQKDIQKYDL